MSRILARLAVAALAAAGIHSTTSAQTCPDTCPTTFSVVANGAFRPGDLVTLTPLNVVDAQSALLGVVGGGTVCNTCEPCKVDLVVSWTIVTSACVSYNVCGLLQSGPGSGSQGGTLTRNCNSSSDLLIEYGVCNPTGMCPPPVVSPAAYTAVWTLTCGDCE